MDDYNFHKELNKKKYSTKKADRRSNNVYQSKSYNTASRGRRRTRDEYKAFHGAKRVLTNSILKSGWLDDLSNEDLDLGKDAYGGYGANRFRKKENQLRDNDKQLHNPNIWRRDWTKSRHLKESKNQNFFNKFGLKYDHYYEYHLQPRYKYNKNLFNTHLEQYIQGKAKGVEPYMTLSEVTKMCADEGFGVMDIYTATVFGLNNTTFGSGDYNYRLAYAALSTLCTFSLKVEYKWWIFNSVLKEYKWCETLRDPLITYNLGKKGYVRLTLYVLIKTNSLRYDLYQTPIFHVTLSKDMGNDTYYYIGSTGGVLAHARGYDIKRAISDQASFIVEEESSTEPKQTDIVRGKVLEKAETDDDDDRTSYLMGRLLRENVVVKDI